MIDKVLLYLDHLIFSRKSLINKQIKKYNYFIALSGDLTSPSSAFISIYKDISSNTGVQSLVEISNKSFEEIMGKSSEAYLKFVSINNLKCIVDQDGTSFDLSEKEDLSNYYFFSCLISQTKNYHFELNVKMDVIDTSDIEYKVQRGFIGYGDFITESSIAIHPKYISMVISKARWAPPNTEDAQTDSSLPNSYVVVYDRVVSELFLLALIC